MGRGIKPGAVALSYVFDLPEKMFLVLPVSVLFATVFTVGALGRHSELTAAKASGVSFHRLAGPIYLAGVAAFLRSEEHTSELQSRLHLVCRLLLEKKKHLPPRARDCRLRDRC